MPHLLTVISVCGIIAPRCAFSGGWVTSAKLNRGEAIIERGMASLLGENFQTGEFRHK